MRVLIRAVCLLTFTVSHAGAQCCGDCNGDGKVTIDELVTAVNDALNGCPATPGPTLTVTFTSTPATTPAATPTTPVGRFVDNGDGTISDNQTGLMWEKKIALDGTVDSTNLHDADNTYHWAGSCLSNLIKFCQPTATAAAACSADVAGDATGCAQCTNADGACNVADTIWTWVTALNAASFAGHSDWRVPKLAELQSLIDYSDGTPPAVNVAFQGASCGSTCGDIASPACSCTRAFHYWSASTYAMTPFNAWYVGFFIGNVDAYTKVNDFYVRAVRGGL